MPQYTETTLNENGEVVKKDIPTELQSSENFTREVTSPSQLMTSEELLNFIKQPGFFDLLFIGGLIETVTSIPTHTPSRFEQQFKIYVDSVTSPTVKTLYFYSNSANVWIAINRSSMSIDTGDAVQFGSLGLGIAAEANVKLKVSGQLYSVEYDNGNSGTTKTIDWANGNSQKLTLTGNCTLTFSNMKNGGNYSLEIVQGSGPYTITWPTTKWENGTAPTLTTTNGKSDMFIFLQRATGLLGAYAYNF